MNEKKLRLLSIIVMVIACVAGCIAVAVTVLKFIEKDFLSGNSSFALVVLGAVIIEILSLVVHRIYYERKTNDTYKLQEWLKYDKKRIEIEQEMERLSMQLANSDISKYLDLNRMIFDGQSQVAEHGLVNYTSFFQQFGIEQDKVNVKKDSAVFLTPFSKSGDKLFRVCQQTLSDVGIFLQRSDNYVQKDDILMNIISLIVQSEIVIANIDGRNPNVYYELGIAHAIGKPTILLSRRKTNDDVLAKVDFDIRQKRIVLYESFDDLKNSLLSQITMIQKR